MISVAPSEILLSRRSSLTSGNAVGPVFCEVGSKSFRNTSTETLEIIKFSNFLRGEIPQIS